jgi:hypothetical protein
MPMRTGKFVAIASTVAIIGAFLLAANNTVDRRDTIRRELAVSARDRADLCREVTTLNTILEAQLRGALARLNTTVNKSDPVYKQQKRLLTSGLVALREHHCT